MMSMACRYEVELATICDCDRKRLLQEWRALAGHYDDARRNDSSREKTACASILNGRYIM
jgi:hypothetical protein